MTSLQQRVQEIIKSSEDTTQRQNVSGARFNALRDTATVQSDSHVSNQSKKWEHSGARPRYRPPETDRCPKPSSLNSLKDCILQQIAEPVAHGVANAFLARHSEDKHLHESLYYNKAEEMLAKDMDSMVKMIDSNKAKPYLGDCQLAAMSDPYYQPYSSAFPLPSEASIRAISEDGFPLDDKFNYSNSVPPPEPSSSYIGANTSQNSCFNSFNPNFGGDFALDTSKPQLLQDGCFTGRDHDKSSVQSGGSVLNGNYGTESVESTDDSLHELEQVVERVPRGREGREEFGQEIKRKEREIRAKRANEESERESEEARRLPQQQELVTGQSLWLCEHYQRCCRVCFPCCKNFYSCHHCHNNSMKCDKEARASHATHLKCSYCNYEQKVMKGF